MIGTDTVENLTQDKVISMMVGRELSEIFKQGRENRCGRSLPGSQALFNKKINDINFSLRKGKSSGFPAL